MPSVLRSVLACSFVVVLGLLPAAGCSRQGEGERCSLLKSGNEDCDSGLSCISSSALIEGITDRCCPAEGTEKDHRCRRGTPASNTGGSSSGGSTSGGSTSGGSTSGGSTSGGSSSGEGGTTSADAGAPSGEGGSGAVDAGGAPTGGTGADEGGSGGGADAGNDAG